MEMSLSEWDVLCVTFSIQGNMCPKYPKVLFFFHLDSFAHLQMDRDQNKQQKKPSNDQSVKLTRPASLSEGQAFWLFEGRIGWGSCKLPNNLSAQLRTVLDITMFHVYLDHTEAFDADPSPG